MPDTLTIRRDALPAIIAALHYHHAMLLARIASEPFAMALYRERDSNWGAMMACREALNDWRPVLGAPAP